MRTLWRRLFKPKPRFKVGQWVKRTWEPETCWRHIDEISERYYEADECECCGQETPGYWSVEYVFHHGGRVTGCLPISWDDQMHSKL